MVGQTISHYPAFWIPLQSGIPGNRNRKRNKILEKLGAVRLVPQSGTDEIRPLVETSTLAVRESRASSQFTFVGERTV
jgi:hypothetical protein